VSEATPRVSVVIPTYRHRDFILATLDSVFAQTMTDLEVIVVNDGSPDDTRDLLRPFVAEGRVQYLEQPNEGQSRARNAGLARARGEYVALLDDDDLWPRDKLEWQTRFLDEHPDVGAVGGTLQVFDERNLPRWQGKFHPAITFESLFRENPFRTPGQTLIRRNLVVRLGGMNASVWGADDWDLWFRIAKVSTIVMLDRLSLFYRDHAANASKQTGRLMKACCETIELHLREVPEAERSSLRAVFHRTVYNGLGSPLTHKARDHLRHGEFRSALRSMKQILPIWRGVVFDAPVRSAFLRDFVRGS
jgi:glycosyltransferase involved in cell wall biosynthesis